MQLGCIGVKQSTAPIKKKLLIAIQSDHFSGCVVYSLHFLYRPIPKADAERTHELISGVNYAIFKPFIFKIQIFDLHLGLGIARVWDKLNNLPDWCLLTLRVQNN